MTIVVRPASVINVLQVTNVVTVTKWRPCGVLVVLPVVVTMFVFNKRNNLPLASNNNNADISTAAGQSTQDRKSNDDELVSYGWSRAL